VKSKGTAYASLDDQMLQGRKQQTRQSALLEWADIVHSYRLTKYSKSKLQSTHYPTTPELGGLLLAQSPVSVQRR
jgi:hypothetical protein